MKTNALMLVAALALASACRASADGPPAIELDRTACARCGMLVSETRFAAAYRTEGGESKVFDDIGCLRQAVRTSPEPRPAVFWFHDAGHGGWLDGRRSRFVVSPEIHTPMGGGILAFGDAAAAASEASARHGRVVDSVDELLRADPQPEKEDPQ